MTVTGRTVQRSDICPHHVTYDECDKGWCRGRIEDIESGRFKAPLIGAPETVEEIRVAKEVAPPQSDSDYLAALASAVIAQPAVPVWDKDCGVPPWPLGGNGWPAKTAYCSKCWKWWTGERAGHCTSCHQTFGSDTAFDTHRIGTYEPDTRRCRDAGWMRKKGWSQDDHGIWRLPKSDHNPFTERKH